LHANLTEKLLTLLLAKLVNFVPEGGIWMNTQRPEWNDANNALVGKGLSIVTLAYLRRTVVFCKDLLQQSEIDSVEVSVEIQKLFAQIFQTLNDFKDTLTSTFTDKGRRSMMEALGLVGDSYRWNHYSNGLSGELTTLRISELVAFLELAQQHIEHSLRANKRSDDLYHAYNILHLGDGIAAVGHLYEMLEGQVAILSSGMLSGEESLSLLESMRNSRLYRADQHSYILYPDKELPGFLPKNTITPAQANELALVTELVEVNDKSLFLEDEDGNFHFAGHIRNLKNVVSVLNALPSQYAEFVRRDSEKIKALFEETFHHNEFTGRSGTFFAYEGLGSIYWHMVSKLLLAVQETIFRTFGQTSTPALMEKYREVRKGLSFNKPPEVYGAFPTDPYSHTPKGQGARQPGMSGMVKEEILTRQKELGLFVETGKISFDFALLDRNEFLTTPSVFSYWNVDDRQEHMQLPSGTTVYSICQVPVVLQLSNEACIEVYFSDGSRQQIKGHVLDSTTSRHIFQRDGVVHHLIVSI
jgi:hypothetical protein